MNLRRYGPELGNLFSSIIANCELLILTFLQTATAQTEYFKVPFTDVLDLVRKRAVYIKKGCAYVSQVSGVDSGTRRVECLQPNEFHPQPFLSM